MQRKDSCLVRRNKIMCGNEASLKQRWRKVWLVVMPSTFRMPFSSPIVNRKEILSLIINLMVKSELVKANCLSRKTARHSH